MRSSAEELPGRHPRSSLLSQAQTARTVVWLALNAAIPVYVGVTYSLFRSTTSAPYPFSHPYTLLFALVSAAAALAARLLPRIMLPDAKIRDLLLRDPDPAALALNPRTGAVDAGRLAEIQELPAHERRLLSLAQASYPVFILRLALHESIALWGFVLSFSLREFWAIVPFAAVALLLNLSVSPRLPAGRDPHAAIP